MIDVLAAEWLKIRTVRSTYYVLGVVAATVGLAALMSWNAAAMWDGLSPARRATFAVAPLANLTSWIASLCLAVLGALTITSEWETGTIRTTFTAVPRRSLVLAAKTAIVAAIALICGQVVSFATFFVSRLIIDGRSIEGQMSTWSNDIPTLLAMGLSMMTFALLGLALGAIMRSATGAIATVAALWYPIPMVAQDLPSPWRELIGSLVPGALAGQLAGTGNDHSIYGALLTPLGALAAMAAYVIVPLGMAAVLVIRRDS